MTSTLRIVFLLVGALCAAPAGATTYRVVDLGTLSGTTSAAYGINNAGQVVGATRVPGRSADHAFLFDYQTAAMSYLPGMSGESVAVDINNQGRIVGQFFATNGTVGAFQYFNGTMLPIGTSGDAFLPYAALAINDNGQIVGFGYDSGNLEAFLYSNGVVTNLGNLPRMPGDSATSINNAGQIVGGSIYGNDPAFLITGGVAFKLITLGGLKGTANSINDEGEIVGSSTTTTNSPIHEHAVMWGTDGRITDLGTLPGTTDSSALDINLHGVIVGNSRLNNQLRGFVYADGQMHDLNQLLDSSGQGWYIEHANAINDNGWIVGYGFYNGGPDRAFLLIPLPEPGSFILALLALLAAGVRKR